MKRLIIFISLVIAGRLALGALSDQDEGHVSQEVREATKREHQCLTEILSLEAVFSYDEKKVMESIHKRFPKGMLMDSLESDLRKIRTCDKDTIVGVGKETNRLWLDVRFIPKKIKDGETKYTFTFVGDEKKELAAAYFIKAHYEGSLSEPVR